MHKSSKITWQSLPQKLERQVNIENDNFPEQKPLQNQYWGKKIWNVVDEVLEQQDKKRKLKYTDWEGKNKTVFGHRWCDYREDPKQLTKKLRELISD